MAKTKDDKAPKIEEKKADDKKSGKVQKPDKADFEARIDKIQKDIDEKKEAISKVIEAIDKKSTGRDEYEAKRSSLFEELAEVKKKRNDLMSAKDTLISAQKAEKEEKYQAKRNQQQMEKEGRDLNEESILSKIAAIEYKLNVRTSNFSLKEEKSMMMEIKSLKKQLPKAAEHTRKLEELKAVGEANAGTDPTAARTASLDEIKAQVDELKAQSAEISGRLDAEKEKRDKQMENVKPLIEKRSQMRDEVSKLMEEKKAIVEERKKAFAAWKEQEEKLRKEAKARQDAEWDAWRAEEAARKAKEELEAPNPYLEEVTLLEQTVDYCNSLLPKVAVEKEDAKEIEHVNPEGYAVLATKKERGDEMYLEAVGGKRGKKGKRNLPSLGMDDPSSKAAKPIKHTAETFSTFKQLEVNTPMTTADLPDLIKILQGKLEKVNAKIAEWESTRKEKVEAARLKALEKGGDDDDEEEDEE